MQVGQKVTRDGSPRVGTITGRPNGDQVAVRWADGTDSTEYTCDLMPADGRYAAVRQAARRTGRTIKAAWHAARPHLPRWMVAAFLLCLAVPGPFDELAMMLMIAGMVACKPAMRREMSAAIRSAWSA